MPRGAAKAARYLEGGGQEGPGQQDCQCEKEDGGQEVERSWPRFGSGGLGASPRPRAAGR